jgi:hypothetical protein
MSDSPPQSPGGSASYDDRYLDAVLSGETAVVPEPLRAVAGAVAALRATPAPAELAGEAAARELFRAHHAPVRAVGQSPLAPAAHGQTGPLTRVQPARASHGAPRPKPHSHRQRRRPAGRRRWPAVALLGGAAAAAAAYATFASISSVSSGSGGPAVAAAPVRPAATLAQPPAITTPKPQVLGGASREPTAAPAKPGSAASPGPTREQALCLDYFSQLQSPGTRWGQSAFDDYWQLMKLAHGPGIYRYCANIGVRTSALAPYSGGHPGGSHGGGRGGYSRGGMGPGGGR